jgi:hypothetical protein
MARIVKNGLTITAMSMMPTHHSFAHPGDYMVRIEKTVPDPILTEGMRIPISDVEVALDETGFRILSGRNPEEAREHLKTLTKKEIRKLIADLG